MKKKIIAVLSWSKAIAEVCVPILTCVFLALLIRILAE